MKILVVSPTPSHPRSAGNRARIHSLLTGLKSYGYEIVFVFLRMEEGDESAMSQAWDRFVAVPYLRPQLRSAKRRFDAVCKMLGKKAVAPYHIDDWYDNALSPVLERLQDEINPDVVLVEYAFLSKAFLCFDNGPLKLLDTHDILAERHRMYYDSKLVPKWFYTTKREEKKALDRADCVLAIQDREAAYFSSLTCKKVLTVGHLSENLPGSDGSTEIPGRILFVGSDNPINLAALNWFADEVLPIVREGSPDVQLEVVGSCADHLRAEAGLILTGRVADLDDVYQRAAVVVNPVRFGTGLKIKAIEALAMGRPLVTTTKGGLGLEDGAGEAFLLADAAGVFAAQVTKVLKDEALRKRLASAAKDYVERYNQTAMQTLKSVLDAHKGRSPAMNKLRIL